MNTIEITYKQTKLKPEWHQVNIEKSDRLPNGRFANELTKEEKLQYLESLGYKF